MSRECNCTCHEGGGLHFMQCCEGQCPHCRKYFIGLAAHAAACPQKKADELALLRERVKQLETQDRWAQESIDQVFKILDEKPVPSKGMVERIRQLLFIATMNPGYFK